MSGVDGVGIPNHLCSSMGYPHIELPSKAYSDAKLDFSPFDVDNRLVASIVVANLGESIELIIR